MTIATMQADKNPTSTKNSASSTEQPEIKAQESEVKRLADEAKWPSRFNIGLLLAAGAVAVLIALNSQWLRRSTGRLSVAEGVLTQLRVAKVKADAEHKIEVDTQQVRSDAATDVTVKTEAVRQEAKTEQKRIETEAQKEIARLTAEAETARLGIATAQAQAAIATENAANANERAEQEALKRVELAKTLSRRTIPFVFGKGKTNLDPLKPFAKIQVMVEYLPETEPYRAAREVASKLSQAGWKVLSFEPNEQLREPWWDGVIVEPYAAKSTKGLSDVEMMRSIRSEYPSQEAATAVVAFLHSNNWEARQGFAERGELPIDTMRIRVGLKPEPRFITAAEEEALAPFGLTQTGPLPRQRETARHLTLQQREAIAEALSKIPLGRTDLLQPVLVRCPAENTEACNFAGEIVELLRSVKWPLAADLIHDKDFPRRTKGIAFREMWRGQFMARAVLSDALRNAGVEVESRSAQEYFSPTEPLQMLVGW